MERVLGIDVEPDQDDVRTEVIDLAIRPWLAGSTISAVQLTIGGVRPPRHRTRLRR
jgi:hypothetical protein